MFINYSVPFWENGLSNREILRISYVAYSHSSPQVLKGFVWMKLFESDLGWGCTILETPMDCSPPGTSVHGSLQARILEWVGSHFLFQRICLIQGLNLCLLHWQVDSLLLSHQGSPLIPYILNQKYQCLHLYISWNSLYLSDCMCQSLMQQPLVWHPFMQGSCSSVGEVGAIFL